MVMAQATAERALLPMGVNNGVINGELLLEYPHQAARDTVRRHGSRIESGMTTAKGLDDGCGGPDGCAVGACAGS